MSGTHKIITPEKIGCYNDKVLVRKRGLEPGSGHFCDSSNTRHSHENPGQPCTQHGNFQNVPNQYALDVRTDSDICQKCGVAFPATKFTQGLHKNNTRVEGIDAGLLADIPSELHQVIVHWSKLPQHIQDGIKATLRGFLLASIDTILTLL